MIEFILSWEFWVGGFLGSALTGWSAWHLGKAAGAMEILSDMEIWHGGEWSEAINPKTGKSSKK